MARPTKFKPEFTEKAKLLCSRGFTNEELAKLLDVCVATIHNWRAQNKEFLDAIKSGKDEYDNKVEQALAERAMGYSHAEEKVFCSEGEVITHETTKHYPPDTTACIFWLKNRRPEQWRDKHEVAVTDSEEYINIIQERRRKALAAMKREQGGERDDEQAADD